MNKLLIIGGSTATGKTALALSIAQLVPSIIISADSRQVYKGMDIGTGKDIPEKFTVHSSQFTVNHKKILYYSDGKTELWGVDLVNPDEEFSLSHFRNFAISIVQKAWQENKMPIVVGGTGLYVRSLTKPLETVLVPKNAKLRSQIEHKSVLDLQNLLNEIDPKKILLMNQSDKYNNRRLIRAIEIAKWQITSKQSVKSDESFSDYYKKLSFLYIGLIQEKSSLQDKIKKRVAHRIEQGVIQEVETLVKKGYGWDLPALSGLGYRQWRDYFEGSKTKEIVIKEWIDEEIRYAKRQLTWFKKESGLIWFEVDDSKYPQNCIAYIKKWYTK